MKKIALYSIFLLLQTTSSYAMEVKDIARIVFESLNGYDNSEAYTMIKHCLVDVDAPLDALGARLLHVLSDSSDDEICEGYVLMAELLQKGANPNIQDKDEYTPLHYAQSWAIPLLLSKGANINSKNKKGRTPLMYAAGHNRIAALKLLIKAEADLNELDMCGKTALHHAIFNKNTECVKILLNSGAKSEIGSIAVWDIPTNQKIQQMLNSEKNRQRILERTVQNYFFSKKRSRTETNGDNQNTDDSGNQPAKRLKYDDNSQSLSSSLSKNIGHVIFSRERTGKKL